MKSTYNFQRLYSGKDSMNYMFDDMDSMNIHVWWEFVIIPIVNYSHTQYFKGMIKYFSMKMYGTYSYITSKSMQKNRGVTPMKTLWNEMCVN